MGLFDSIKQIADTAASPPPIGDPSDAEGQRHAKYHKRILFVGGRCAVIGVVLGVLISVAVASDVKTGRQFKGIILAPVMFDAGGFLFGMAIMCLVAPRAFLTGPVGGRWMKLIGTKSVLVARIACLLFGLVVTIPLVGIGLLIVLGYYGEPGVVPAIRKGVGSIRGT